MPYEPMQTTLIPNTTMKKFINSNGVHTQYVITPNEGYVLHDNRLDIPVQDPETLMPTDEIQLGYYAGNRSVSVNYDFDNVVVGTDGNTSVNKIGEYELYAILRTDVPENRVFDITQPPEIMSEDNEAETE